MKRRSGPLIGPASTTIVRAPHGEDEHWFVKVSRALAQDENLSFEARGILLYLLSKPRDWLIQLTDLQRAGNTGRDRVLRILNELEARGYLVWSARARRKKKTDGTFEWAAPMLFEIPYTGFPTTGNPEDGKPASGKADAYKLKTSQSSDEQENERHTHTADRTAGSKSRVCVSKSKFSLEQNLQYAWAAYQGKWGVNQPDAWAAANFSKGTYDELVKEYLADPKRFRAAG